MNHSHTDLQDLPRLLEQQVAERTAELEMRTRQLMASQQVIFSLEQATSPDMLLSLLITGIPENFGLEHVRIYLLDQPEEKLFLRQSPAMAALPLFNRAEMAAGPWLLTEVDLLPNPGIQAGLIIPLTIDEQVMGGLEVFSPQPQHFTPHLIALFETIARQLVFRLQNVRLLARTIEQAAQLNQYTHQLKTAADLAHHLNSILEPNQLITEMVNLVQLRFKLFHARVYLVDSATGNLLFRAGSGEPVLSLPIGAAAISPAHPHSLVAQAARTGLPVIGRPASTPPENGNLLFPVGLAQLSVPLIGGEQVLGVLDLYHTPHRQFSQIEVNTFNALAGQLATAIENARYFEESKQIAERLRGMDRLKNEFLASMSHELRTPLNSIIGYSEILLMGISGELSPQARQDIQAISENGRHLMLLINDILDLAKIEAGSVKLQKEYVPVAYIFDNIQSRNAVLFRKKPVEFLVETAEDLPPIYVDSLRFGQILNNLVSNAAKFTQTGYVKVRAFMENGQVCITVEDTGIGISPANLEHIFDKFWQVDGSYARRAEGTGLGLTITRELVHLHQGTISVESRLGQGTTFTIRLPDMPLPASPGV